MTETEHDDEGGEEPDIPDEPDEEEDDDLVEAYEGVLDAPVDEPPPDEGDAKSVEAGDGKA